MDLSIITVTWNSKDIIAKQMMSVVAGCKDITCEQFIVDNASSDGTLDIVRKQFPDVHIIANKENKGFSVANNQAIGHAHGKYLLFLNPDMRVAEGSLDTIVAWMDNHPDVAIVSPKLMDEHGKANADAMPRRFPKLWEQLALIFKLPHIFSCMLDRYYMKDFDTTKEQQVDSVRGSFMLMRGEFVDKLGWAFDPRYYIWYEDVDICREAYCLGYTVMYTPVISCIDYVGQSFKKRNILWKQKNFTKSMLTYFKKWEPWYVWIWILFFRPVGISLAWLNDFFYKIKN